MGCHAPLPAGYQLQIAQFLTGHAKKAPNISEAKQHVQRAINALGGTRGRYFKLEQDIRFPVHGLGLGEGAIAELEHMIGQQLEGAREAHKIVQFAEDVLHHSLHQNDINDIQRLSSAASLLVQAAVEVIRF